MSKQYHISEGRYVLISNKRDALQNYPKRFWEIEITENKGDKCEHRTWSTRARRNRRAGL